MFQEAQKTRTTIPNLLPRKVTNRVRKAARKAVVKISPKI
jgi:hypothetical protein